MGGDGDSIYTSTGWRQVNGQPVYLHADGAIGAEGTVSGVEVRLGAVLDSFRVPPPPTDAAQTREAVRASIDLLGVAPLRITAPLLGLVYRSVLGNTDLAAHSSAPPEPVRVSWPRSPSSTRGCTG